MNNYESEKLTNEWLKANGLDAKILTKWDKEMVQAKMVATNLLKHHARLLEKNQAASLNRFLVALQNKRTRDKIKKGDCYRVMNIGAAVNRQLFKAHRKNK